MLESLLSYSDSPVWLVLVIIVSTFMLEDLAIIAAALLAAGGRLAPELTFAAVCSGMFIGDSALYLAGRLAHVCPWLGRHCRHPLISRQITPLQQAPWHQLALIRCMPGLRTFGYVACGIARVPAVAFSLANFVSILAWAGLLFGVAYMLGRQYAEQVQEALWWLLPLALLLFVVGQKRLRSRLQPG